MQIIPRGENIWGNIGTSLGELAGEKLGNLLKEKRAEKEKSRFKQTWSKLLGDKRAEELSNFSPEERQMILNNPSFLMELGKENISPREQIGMNALQQQYQQPQQEQYNPQQEARSTLQNYFNNPTLGGGKSNLMNLLGGSQQPEQLMQQYQEQPRQMQQEEFTPEKAQLVKNLFMSPQERLAQQKEMRENRKLELAEKREILKETKPYINALKEKEKAAKEGNLRLKRMEQLVEKGNLPNSALWSALTKVEEAGLHGAGGGAVIGGALGTLLFPGLGTASGAALGAAGGGIVGSLMSPLAGAAKTFIKSGSPDVEEFEKLSTEFVKNAKQYFGSRITEREVQLFMNTIPTLMQTDAGKKKVIENIRSLNELVDIEAKAARSIIKENGGIPPIDLEQQVQDKISKRLDKVAKEFITR